MAKRIIQITSHNWLDKNTFLAVTRDYRDKHGKFHYEVEYHKDEKKYVTVKCYEHEVVKLDYRETNLYAGELVKQCTLLMFAEEDHETEAMIAHAH